MSGRLWSIAIGVLLAIEPFSMAQEVEIKPAHVYQHVALVRAELDLIRLEIGKPEVTPPFIEVENAEPREVYFQAVTLFRKADRLAFENVRERVEELSTPQGEIKPAHVRLMVDAALERVRRVKQALGISEASTPPPLDPGKQPSQVLLSIVAANREINQLLTQQFSPGDVYQQVTVAIAYASRLLDSPDAVSTPPEPPEYERRKRPADVYLRLVDCYDDLHRIGDAAKVPMLDLKVKKDQVDGVEPSDVYDIASLLVSELSHLYTKRPEAAPRRKVHNPGRKIPSDVYQRLGILCTQMEALLEKVKSEPDWFAD
jgi:hypothetical protein